MSGNEWRRVPVGPDAGRWATRTGCRTVLLIVHTVTSGQRLLDAARLLENDLRVQTVFTQGPDVFGEGVPEFLAGLGAATVPWAQAVQTRFDLAVAASYGGLHEVHAPLIVMPHGAGFTKFAAARAGRAVGSRLVYGLDPQRLVHDGALIPSAIALPHTADRAALARSCPAALPVASVVGDPAYDALVASRDRRSSYQVALGAGDGRKLVVVTSTWGRNSLLGRRPELWSRLLSDLPGDGFQVVTLLHPNLWSAYGTWQIRAWMADHLRRGLRLVPPEADWRGVLAAADWVIGDHGSATVYAAVMGVPVLLGGFHDADVSPGSPAARLGEAAPRLTGRGSLHRRLVRAAAEFRPEALRQVTARITSEPGRFGRNMRQLMYRQLRLPQPASVPVTPPALPPFLVS
ncbi:UDP-N-acetyl glucosamine 2-epimerase [Actinomadura macrotermitis]|uniref:Uncharacterized protein n=1 Tax=Actinomadura macrotermitis TaxID=2585200 RepID=A0A7K0BZE9_9ACTN|nr:hypothetical protein [Actinomadura macrotermitis]MQY06557.1 hypothetical protein [Actinomadura macrotermitis]